jgi:lipid-A-disaccharide synthase-like uncharacterized protein
MKILSPFLKIFHAKRLKKTDAWYERIGCIGASEKTVGKKKSDANKSVKIIIFWYFVLLNLLDM